jgi:PAS domain S-box-containing protein
MANSIVSFTPEPELFELLEDLIIVHNLEGRIRYINRYVQKLLGYSPYDVLNKSILNFLPNRYKEKYLHYLQSIKREKYLTGVVVVLTEKGQERLLEYRNAVYFRDGKPEGVVGICRDYTQRERMEKALTEAMGRFESIIKHTPMVAVQGFDANGCIYHWNPVSEKLYGMSIKEVLEKPFHKLFLKGKEERKFLNDLKWVFDRGLPVENREFAINTANGEKKMGLFQHVSRF